jgi:purine-binding chemotaxis protein CheW
MDELAVLDDVELMGDGEQVVSFRIGDEILAVGVDTVYEIVRMREVTEVPQVPSYVHGVINLRGHIIPVINLRNRLGLEEVEETRSTRIIVVELGGESIGMVVDAVDEVVTVPTDAISPPSPVLISIDTDFVRGIARLEDRLIILLDVLKVTQFGAEGDGGDKPEALPAGDAAAAPAIEGGDTA